MNRGRHPAPEDRPLMAQAVATAVRASKRQVQIWTDAGVLHCLPATDRQGRGRQRLYERDELRFAALARCLAQLTPAPIGVLLKIVDLVRAKLAAGENRAAWLGQEESCIVVGGPYGPLGQFLIHWNKPDVALRQAYDQLGVAVIVNVRAIMSTIRW
jgi:hypothetical protein